VKAYGDNALSETMCRNWFRRFNDDNFDLSDKKRENRPRKVEDYQLQALLDEDDTQSQKMFAKQLGVSQAAISMRLHAMGKVQKIGKWMPHELNDRQMERRHTCQILLTRQKRKSFLHRIMTGDEKWIYFQNPKRKKSWIDPAQSLTSSSKPNRFGRKTLCVWWDQEGVIYYELLKLNETVNAHGYHQQLIKLHCALREKRPHYRKRHDKLIFLHDNAPSHMSTMVQNLETLNWKMLPHPAYSPDLAPSDYHLFLSMGHALAEGHFDSYEDVRKWLDEWLPRKMRNFFGVVYTNCPKDGKNISEGKYFE